MKKELLLYFFLLLCIGSTSAQVQLQALLPATGVMQKAQLWNMVLVNGSAADLNGRIELKLRDRETGLEVLTAASNMVILKKGANMLQEQALSPVQYQYTGIRPDMSINGLLPAGKYMACYAFLNIVSERQEYYGEECFSFDIEALSPPMLVHPADSSRLSVTPTQFSWISPAPATMFQNLNYDFMLVEVSPGQMAPEALQENTPVFNMGNVTGNVWNILSASTSLQAEKWYAWQVIARDNDKYVGKSEAWLFYINPSDSIRRNSEAVNYTVLSAETQRISHISLQGSVLSVKHYSYLSGHVGVIEVVSEEGIVVQQLKQFIRYGDNYLQIPIPKKTEEGKIYTLSLIDGSGKKYSVLFSTNDQNK